MQVDTQLVQHLAKLSRLEFSAEEAEMIRQDLGEMTGLIDKLHALDTSGIEPLRHMPPITDNNDDHALRDDDPGNEMLSNADALREARQSSAPYFVVPKVISR